MFSHTISAVLVGCSLLLAPIAATAADRGPSTPEERKQALDYIQDFEANPLGPNAMHEREWVVTWVIEIPDVHVEFCSEILDKLNKSDEKDGGAVLAAMIMSQTAFALRNPDKQADRLAQYQAGVEGVLRVYETLLKTNPKDQQPYLDDLIQRRDAGTLPEFVKDRAHHKCKN
jgi:carboxypeptidase Q